MKSYSGKHFWAKCSQCISYFRQNHSANLVMKNMKRLRGEKRKSATIFNFTCGEAWPWGAFLLWVHILIKCFWVKYFSVSNSSGRFSTKIWWNWSIWKVNKWVEIIWKAMIDDNLSSSTMNKWNAPPGIHIIKIMAF